MYRINDKQNNEILTLQIHPATSDIQDMRKTQKRVEEYTETSATVGPILIYIFFFFFKTDPCHIVVGHTVHTSLNVCAVEKLMGRNAVHCVTGVVCGGDGCVLVSIP